MRLEDGEVVLSPSDLMRFQACEHAAALDLRYLRGEPLIPAADGADALLLQKKGHSHEAAYLRRLPAAVIEIDRNLPWRQAAGATRDAMANGAPFIYQGALATGRW